MIQIMKASAGSGKTFNLARKYITLLFRKNDRAAYRHILAVTFTNKATDEMKSRILRELHILSTDPSSSGYLKWFIPGMFPAEQLEGLDPADFVTELPGRPGVPVTTDSLKECAREMLCAILHDYSAFSISTIDRFFQQTLKAFSREIGQFSSYQVELDKDLLISETVDRIFDSLTDDSPHLLRWLTDCAIEQVENGGSYDITRSLVKMASRLKSDQYRDLAEARGVDGNSTYSYENLQKIRKLCRSVITGFRKTVMDRADAAISAMENCGLRAEDFYRGFPKVLYSYRDLDGNAVISAPETFLARGADPESWFPKARQKDCREKADGLEIPFGEFCSLFEDGFRIYNTARLIAGQLYELGLSADIDREFNAVLKDNNVLSIDDSNLILKNIIDGSDAPFVYEKTGVRYENFLLDEFQDTSRIQWENFRPLLENSHSQNFENLIVGDVKQSIYRWRGSEWKLLHESLEQDMPGCVTSVLDSNFRSCRKIVEFNNAFFPYAAGRLDAQYGSGNVISGIYSDVCQKTASKSGDEGIVEISFAVRDRQTDAVLKIIERLTDAGAGYGDIAVLVRNNISGARVAEDLIRHSVPVVTDDSLKVKSSSVVRRMVSLMAYMDNPRNTLGSYLANSMNIRIPDRYRSLPDLCESIARAMQKEDEAGFTAEATYVQSFVDCVLDYSSKNGNSLHDFLAYWDGADPNVCSPALSDAVRIITVHKSKGLDFGYVIFPFAETVTLYRPSDVWCSPDFSDTDLAPAGNCIFDVSLSESSSATLFAPDYRREKLMQYIDNLNIFYVALTRAVKGMHVIAEYPSASFLKSMEKGAPDSRNMSHVLYSYIHEAGVRTGFREGELKSEDIPESFVTGEMPSFASGQADAGGKPSLQSSYPSYPLNPEVPEEDGGLPGNRLVFSTDSQDYFSEEGRYGLYSSGRLRGIILHRILASVNVEDDLHKAVSDAIASGFLPEDEAEEAEKILSSKIRSVADRKWFSGDGVKILNEVSLIDSDGSLYRPDRVLVGEDGKVTVLDYKFGAKEHGHRRQVLRYADMWKRKGYAEVSAYLWYVMEDEVVEV